MVDPQTRLMGYLSDITACPGDRLRLHVSTPRPAYTASLVRVFCGDDRPGAPGRKLPAVAAELSWQLRGQARGIPAGSHVVVDDEHARLSLERNQRVVVSAWFRVSAPVPGRRQVLCGGIGERTAYELGVGPDGRPYAYTDFGDAAHEVRGDAPVAADTWWHITATMNAARRSTTLELTSVGGETATFTEPSDGRRDELRAGLTADAAGTFLIAGATRRVPGTLRTTVGAWNGKIEDVTVRTSDDVDDVNGGDADDNALAEAASWDFSARMDSDIVVDTGPHGLHGRVINAPDRAVTGRLWDGTVLDPRLDARHYGAIQFNEEDLDDAAWPADLEIQLPDTLPSGVYAVRLAAGAEVDLVPFVVTPTADGPRAGILVLLPTDSYLAYGNERLLEDPEKHALLTEGEIELKDTDEYLAQHPELGFSLYDKHVDGTGSAMSSRLRPLLNIRPDYLWRRTGAPRHFAADLYLIDWLHEHGYQVDVATDEDLNAAGRQLLDHYAVVLTGSHPEYVTHNSLTSLQSYVDDGGRLCYLGGNGFYWVTGRSAAAPHRIEVRRGHTGTRPWTSRPGETHLASTGEPGGLWRYRGRAPQVLTGVGFTAQGWGTASPYRRTDASYDDDVSFIFDGVDAPEFGDAGLIMGGAAGDEVDRADVALGTPAQTKILASSSRLGPYYQLTVEECEMTLPGRGGGENADVRADMTYYSNGNGGAVFSTGSICWMGCLPVNGYDNDVSRILRNVVDRFATRHHT